MDTTIDQLDPSNVTLVPEPYGTTEQMYKAFKEGAARGATMGVSDIAQAAAGNQHAVAARAAANPITSWLGNITGFVGANVLTEGLAGEGFSGLATGLAAKAGAGRIAAPILGEALVGTGLGVGNVISDKALGDPDLTVSKAMSQIGFGAATGAALGAFSSWIKGDFKAPESAINGEPKIAPNLGDTPEAPPHLQGNETPNPEDPGIIAPDPNDQFKAKSLADIQAHNEEQMAQGASVKMPQADAVEAAESRLTDLKNPMNDLQRWGLQSKANYGQVGTYRLLEGDIGKTITDAEALQKNERVDKLWNTVEDTTPNPVLENKTDAGNVANDYFEKNYKQEKGELIPQFDEMKKLETPDPFNHVPGVVDAFKNILPDSAEMFDLSTPGEVKINPYNDQMGITKLAYDKAKTVIDSLNERPAFMKEIYNLRRKMLEGVSYTEAGEGPSQIRMLQRGLLNYMEDQGNQIAAQNPESKIDFGFLKRWALNEGAKDEANARFGTNIGEGAYGKKATINPETITKNMFNKTGDVQVAKSLLTPEQFEHVRGNWVAGAIHDATTDGNFSSAKFSSWLKSNAYNLEEAFADKPEALQRIRDLTLSMKYLPDAVSKNPSNTAQTVLGLLTQGNFEGFAKALKKVGTAHYNDWVKANEINRILSGQQQQNTILGKLGDMVSKSNSTIAKGAKAVFSPLANTSVATKALSSAMDQPNYDKTVKRIRELSDPQTMMNHLNQNTAGLLQAAPNVTQSLQNTLTTGVSFLNSKIPGPLNHGPFDPPFTPSKSQIQKFSEYYDAVDKPLKILDQLKQGSINPASLEALMAVHPKLLHEMQQKVLENYDPKKVENMGYAQKIAISKFMAQPLSKDVLPQSIMANQNAMSPMAQASANPQGGRVTQGGMAKLAIGGRTASATRAISEPQAK